jgi:hypothetical protein
VSRGAGECWEGLIIPPLVAVFGSLPGTLRLSLPVWCTCRLYMPLEVIVGSDPLGQTLRNLTTSRRPM